MAEKIYFEQPSGETLGKEERQRVSKMAQDQAQKGKGDSKQRVEKVGIKVPKHGNKAR